MESVVAAVITGILTLMGVLVSNSRSQAVLEVKIDELSARVEKHNQVVERTYALEQRMAVIEHDLSGARKE